MVLPLKHVEAVAEHRTHRAHAQQLRVVAQAKICRQAGKALVEDEFAVAVPLQIQRGHGNRTFISPQGQMQRLPALLRNDAAGGFQGLQPTPAVEGDGLVPDQLLPVLLRDLTDRLVPAGGESRHRVTPPAVVAETLTSARGLERLRP